VEAVSKAIAREYDIIFMDMQMPEMDGVEATLKMFEHCKNKGAKQPVIIALTASVMEKDKEKCIAAGMKDFLSKPFTPNNLIDMILKWHRA
jgi:CheY-like chemotaxis protein